MKRCIFFPCAEIILLIALHVTTCLLVLVVNLEFNHSLSIAKVTFLGYFEVRGEDKLFDPYLIYHFIQHDRVMAEFPQDSDTSTLAVEDCECVLEGCMQLRYCRCNTRNTQTCNRYKTFHVERYPHAWNLGGLLTLGEYVSFNIWDTCQNFGFLQITRDFMPARLLLLRHKHRLWKQFSATNVWCLSHLYNKTFWYFHITFILQKHSKETFKIQLKYGKYWGLKAKLFKPVYIS